MQQHSIRDLKAHLSEYLKVLPFEITNHNKVIAVVSSTGEMKPKQIFTEEESDMLIQAVDQLPPSKSQPKKEKVRAIVPEKKLQKKIYLPKAEIKPEIVKTIEETKITPHFGKCKQCEAGLDASGLYCLGKKRHKQ